MAITTVYTYPLDGTMKDFNVPFEYLARRFVALTLIGKDRKELVLGSDYRFTSKTSVQTTKAWGAADGYDWLEIRRNTSATDRLVDFADGSILRASDLNASQVQTLHVAEEARNMVADTIAVNNDGDLDARGRRLVNLADAVHDGDAVTLRQERTWAGSALNQADRAKTEADRATAQASAAASSESASKTSETNAKSSENAAKVSETNAKVSETKAKTSETNAQDSATAAAGSAASALAQADRAQTEADRAQTEADKLSDMNAFASVLGETTASQVSFKDDVAIQMGKKGRYYGLVNVQNANMPDGGANDGQWPANSPTLRFLNHNNTEVRWSVWSPADKNLYFAAGRTMFAIRPSGIRSWGSVKAGGLLKVNNNGNAEDDAWFATLSWNVLTMQGDDTANHHIWFRRSDGTERALIYVEPNGRVHFRVNGNESFLVNTDQSATVVGNYLFLANGSNGVVAHDGNIKGSMWGGRWLSDWLRDPGWETAGATHIMAQNVSGAAIGPGGVTGGENLIWSSHNNAGGGRVNFGQWKCCGYANGGGVTLWRRVG